MKIKVIVLIFCLATQIKVAFAQSEKYVIAGLVKDDIMACTDINSIGTTGCIKSLLRGTIVPVSAIKRFENAIIFEVYYNSKKLYISEENLIVDKAKIEMLSNFNTEELDSTQNVAISASAGLYRKNVKKALDFLDGTKPFGLAVLKWTYYDESEYTEGTSVEIEVYNPTKKTVKYVWFSFIGLNAVGDRVLSKGKSIITTRGIGPIKPDGTGKYSFDYVWFTDIVDTVKISQLKIQYMDGTFKNIVNPKLVTMSNQNYSVLMDSDEDN